MSLPHTMSDDILPMDGATPESAAYHLDVANRERAAAFPELRPQTPLMASADVVPFLRRQDDALFHAPSNVFRLQAEESAKAAKLAEHIACVVFNRALMDLPPSAQKDCRYLAVHAVRMTNRNWRDAALSDGMKACVRWMREDGGKAFRHLPDANLEAIAGFLVPAVLAACEAVSEGSGVMLPGRYLAITEGRGL